MTIPPQDASAPTPAPVIPAVPAAPVVPGVQYALPPQPPLPVRGSGRTGRLVAGWLLIADGALSVIASLLYLGFGIGVDTPNYFAGPLGTAQTILFLVSTALAVVAYVIAAVGTRGPDGIVGRSRVATVGFIALAAWLIVEVVVSRALPYIAAAAGIGMRILSAVNGVETIVEVALLAMTAVAIAVGGAVGGPGRFALLLAPIAVLLSAAISVVSSLVATSLDSYQFIFLAQSMPGAVAAVLIGTAYVTSRGRGIRSASGSTAQPVATATPQ